MQYISSMGIHTPLRKDAYSVRTSSAGLGLYAEQPIKKGQKVIEYIGNRLTDAQAQKRGGKYLFEVNSRWTIDGTPRRNTARYLNHSCAPNCEPREIKGRIYIYAIKNINTNDELTYNYGPDYHKRLIQKYPSGCMCAKCQKEKKSGGTKKKK